MVDGFVTFFRVLVMVAGILVLLSSSEYLQREDHDMGEYYALVIFSIVGILGSYGVAWFGIRINTVANSRAAFSALQGNALATLGIPLRSGMSVGLLLVCVELFFMICILIFLPNDLVGPCFIGFAIGESLGASALVVAELAVDVGDRRLGHVAAVEAEHGITRDVREAVGVRVGSFEARKRELRSGWTGLRSRVDRAQTRDARNADEFE